MKRTIWTCLLVIAIAMGTLGAADASQTTSIETIGDEANVYPPFRDLRDAVNNEYALDEIQKYYKAAYKGIITDFFDDEAVRYYWLSRIEYFYGKAIYYDMMRNLPPLPYENPWCLAAMLAKLEREENPEAANHYEKSIHWIEESMELAGPYSEAYWVKGLSIGQLCMVKGLGFLIGNGLKSETYAKKAIRMNEDDGKALLLLGQRFAFPPKGFYGGNPDKARRLLSEAETKANIEKDDLYDIYVAYANTYMKTEEYEIAIEYFDKALALYPGSSLVRIDRDRIAETLQGEE